MNAEQWQVFLSKPVARMQRFAELLNWKGLRLQRIVFSVDEVRKWNVPKVGLLCYYLTSDSRFCLQINEQPSGQPVTHRATITADRYGIRSIGWHPFTLYPDEQKIEQEAERLRPMLDRALYKDKSWLREYKIAHPQFVVPSRKKVRGKKNKTSFLK